MAGRTHDDVIAEWCRILGAVTLHSLTPLALDVASAVEKRIVVAIVEVVLRPVLLLTLTTLCK